jgi:hypothetical protein
MPGRQQPLEVITGGDKPPSRIVTVRCRSCAQRLGRSSPTLAVVGFSRPGDHSIYRIKRVPAGQADPADPPTDPLADRAWWVSVASVVTDARGKRSIRQPKGVELACRECPHRPRKRQRDLFKLAEQALAEGRTEIYV